MKESQIAGVLTPVLAQFGLELEAVEIIPAGKRRLLFELGELGLPIESFEDRGGGLGFDLLSSSEEPVTTGHADGIITLTVPSAAIVTQALNFAAPSCASALDTRPANVNEKVSAAALFMKPRRLIVVSSSMAIPPSRRAGWRGEGAPAVTPSGSGRASCVSASPRWKEDGDRDLQGRVS